MQITTETVYKNRDNPNQVRFYEDNAAMDFSAVTRVVLDLYNAHNVKLATVDTSDSPILITYTTNVITFNLNSLALSAGRYYAKVVVYDSQHPEGQILAHPDSRDSQLVFRFTYA